MQTSGLTQAELAGRVDLDPTALSKAFAGKRLFKSLELARIAEVLDVRVDALLADDDTLAASRMAARTQPTGSASEILLPAIRRAEQLIELDRLLDDLGYPAPSPIQVAPPTQSLAYEQGEELANSVRSRVELGAEDLPDKLDGLAEFCEKRLGIDVAFEPLGSGLDGLSVACDSFRLTLVSSGISATRQRFSLAHEIGHIFAEDSDEILVDENVYSSRSHAETRANSFAASFLMPREALVKGLEGKIVDEQLVADLLGRFRVSLDALAFRLHNVRLINASTRDRVRAMSSNRIALRSGRTDDLQARNDHRSPTGLLVRAMNAYVEGSISVRPLAELLQVDEDLLLDELTPAGRRRVIPEEDDIPAL
jgi:Zn-dependent peptidase ImmA (M78 family)/transcriptional regulator with XRE-family HTH domain